MAHIAYTRVSSVDQSTIRQLSDVQVDKLFSDNCSGKDRDRPGLQRCLQYLREGDVLHVHSIDRLARNMTDLQAIVEGLTAEGISVVFHSENLTFDSGKGNPMQILIFQILGAFGEFERNMIRERQREGIAAARKRGVRLGPRPKLDATQLAELKKRADSGESKQHLAKAFGLSRQSVYRLIKAA